MLVNRLVIVVGVDTVPVVGILWLMVTRASSGYALVAAYAASRHEIPNSSTPMTAIATTGIPVDSIVCAFPELT